MVKTVKKHEEEYYHISKYAFNVFCIGLLFVLWVGVSFYMANDYLNMLGSIENDTEKGIKFLLWILSITGLAVFSYISGVMNRE